MRVEDLGVIVSTSTGQKEFGYRPRFDIELSRIGKVALIAPDDDYAIWGSFGNRIPFWDPIRDGEHCIVANRRDGGGSIILTRPIYDPVASSSPVPVYNLEKIALNVSFPEVIDADGRLQCFYGSSTTVAQAYYYGQHLYGVRLDTGEKVLVAGEGLDPHCGKKIHVVAKRSGKADRIARPIYIAELLTEVRDAA